MLDDVFYIPKTPQEIQQNMETLKDMLKQAKGIVGSIEKSIEELRAECSHHRAKRTLEDNEEVILCPDCRLDTRPSW